MDSSYIKDVQDCLTWYNWHAPTIKNMPLERKVEFLEKAVRNFVGLLAGLVDQVIIIEEGEKARKRQILLPVGVKWDK